MAKRKASRATGRKKAAKKTAARRRPVAARKARKPVKKTARKATRPARRKATARKKVVVRKKVVARKKATVRKATARNAVQRRPAPASRATARGKVPSLNRERRIVREDDIVPTPPSSLDLNRTASAARSGRRELHERFVEHTESPAITGGDIDADWESAATVGDEAPGGDNPTPDMDIVDDIGKALGVQYDDNEELMGEKKVSDRDRHRWELDPASAEDYNDKK